MKRVELFRLAAALILSVSACASAFGQTTNQTTQYTLLEGSELSDDCLICGRPTIIAPMRGTFRLRLQDQNPLFSTYAVEDISFTAGPAAGRQYRVTGSGTHRIGGEVAQAQQMFLQVQIDDGFTSKLCYFTNESSAIDRPWPMLHINLHQTNGTLLQVYELTLAAAPLREIWFSTVSGFTPAVGPSAGSRVSGGALVSSAGRVVKSNNQLTGRLGIMPVAPDVGLDAADILPRGEIAFSIGQDVFSETLGQLHRGDLLSSSGYIVRRNEDLLAPFMPQPVFDVGLDAVQVLDTGEILFSIQSDVYSQRLRVSIRHGDLLSSTGQVRRTHQQLLAHFHPPVVNNDDWGLDAVYVWSHGEIWFSIGIGFQDQMLGPIGAGDLLSDQGYMVFRNLELLGAFAPIEDLADFGLDALFIVTDALPPAAPPLVTKILLQPSSGNVRLEWDGQGRVFQLERAASVPGSFLPASPIQPDLSFDDLGALKNQSNAFYRVRQW